MYPRALVTILAVSALASACTTDDGSNELTDADLPVLVPDAGYFDAALPPYSGYDATIPTLLSDGSVGPIVISDGALVWLDSATTPPDGGTNDGGNNADATSGIDAETATDASVSPVDAAAPNDAAPMDAQSPVDASTPVDSAAPIDANTAHDAATDAGSTTTPRTPPANKLPSVSGTCPTLADGTVTVAGAKVKLWVGPKAGPLVFYFHGTGTTPDEVQQGLPGAVDDIKRNGGIVASWDTTNAQGDSTGSFWTVWYTGDFQAADQLLACALQRNLVDASRIHVAGYSAGGLQTGAMMFMRSNYLASGIVYSGGKGFGAQSLQDPSNTPAGIMAHGAKGQDTLVLDFSDWTHNLGTELKGLGGFEIECDDGGGHVSATRLGVQGKAWQFLKDHPYQTKPSPYAGGLPSGWPSYCKIM